MPLNPNVKKLQACESAVLSTEAEMSVLIWPRKRKAQWWEWKIRFVEQMMQLGMKKPEANLHPYHQTPTATKCHPLQLSQQDISVIIQEIKGWRSTELEIKTKTHSFFRIADGQLTRSLYPRVWMDMEACHLKCVLEMRTKPM